MLDADFVRKLSCIESNIQEKMILAGSLIPSRELRNEHHR